MGKDRPPEVALLRDRAAEVDVNSTAVPPALAPLATSPHALAPEMFLRMLFSCLTDADSLDTEQHMNPVDAEKRQAEALAMPELRDRLVRRQQSDFFSGSPFHSQSSAKGGISSLSSRGTSAAGHL